MKRFEHFAVSLGSDGCLFRVTERIFSVTTYAWQAYLVFGVAR